MKVNRYIDKDFYKFWNGTFKEHFDALITSNGTTITLTVTPSDTILTAQFSSGTTILSTPSTATLTAGSDTIPQQNYAYILESDPSTIVISTTGWPAEEHIRIGFFFVPSATFVQNYGCYINQNWNDGYNDGNETGHITHLGAVIRRGGIGWFSGTAGEGSDGYIDLQVGGTEMYIKVGAGVISQMHLHNFAAIDTSTTGQIHIANHNTTPYLPVQDLGTILVDSTGASLSGKYYNIILGGVANKGGEYSPIMCNYPSGSYNNVTDAINDANNYDNTAMPREFGKESSNGFYLSRVTIKHSPAGGGTFTIENEVDLRDWNGSGGITGGGVGGTVTEFSDTNFKVFDNLDTTKIIQLTADNISTGNTRTITMADVDIDLADIVLNNTHRDGDGSDHTDVAQNTSDISDNADDILTNTDLANEREINFTVFDPNSVYDIDTQVFVMVAKRALTIEKITVSCDATTNQVTGDLKWADAFIGFANATVINDFDTTSGVRVDDTITNPSVAAGKAIYIQFDAQPHADITQINFNVEYSYD